MRYHCLHIHTDFAETWQQDLFDQAVCDLGIDTIEGEYYYLPSDIWREQDTAIRALITDTMGAELLSEEACPDANWNATWEAEHPVQELPLGVRIVPHCAFGAGHHETTAMMVEALMEDLPQMVQQQPVSVFDHGTGTGVLAIFAKKLGAAHVVAVDIDDKSVTNARENALLNKVEIEVRLASSPPADDKFHLIVANIHRNVLVANLPAYATCLRQEGQLWLSGFYEDDCPFLQAAAEAQGLQLTQKRSNGEWRMLQFTA